VVIIRYRNNVNLLYFATLFSVPISGSVCLSKSQIVLWSSNLQNAGLSEIRNTNDEKNDILKKQANKYVKRTK